MGRNFYSVCDKCQIVFMHLSGEEGAHMQEFANTHSEHEKSTRVLNDYVDDIPDDYMSVGSAAGTYEVEDLSKEGRSE